MRSTVTPIRGLMLVLAAAAPVQAQDPPLFDSNDVVALTIRAPLERIFSHRDQESEEYPGVIVVDAGTRLDTVEVDIRTRGRSRLDRRICRFPPLRLDFPRSRVAGTLFEEQNRVKLVTHCREDDRFEQDMLVESLAYRILNLLTDVGFRVRVARITYEDTGGERDPVTRYGFLVEHEDAVAARTGWRYLPIPSVPPEATDPDHLALLEVYQYLIGNTDWSAFAPDPGSDECCHNTKPIGAPAGPVFTLPYDFDITGLVDAPYARNLYQANLQQLGLRNVRERRFRGICTSESLWPDALATLRERRADIEGLIRGQEGLAADRRDEALDYIGDFYEELDDEARLLRTFRETCIPG